MNSIRICTVVIGKNLDEFLTNLKNTQKVADFVELRVDHIKNLSINQLDSIREKTTRKAIFTCRNRDEGGMFKGTANERKAIIEKACALEFEYIDVELSTLHTLDSSKLNSRVILSFHDFTGTPSLVELDKIKNEMKKYPGAIMKFACMVKRDYDVKTLLEFLLDKRDGEKMIVIGMGEKGKLVRIVGPLLGSYLTFASTPSSYSVPGQIDSNELKSIYNKIATV